MSNEFIRNKKLISHKSKGTEMKSPNIAKTSSSGKKTIIDKQPPGTVSRTGTPHSS